VLGRQVRFVVVDGGRSPLRVADTVDALVTSGAVAAVTGWHISAVRQAIAPRVTGRVPYVYTPLYEGGERTPGVFLVGETPSQQLLPSMRWMATELGVRRWCVVGDDYVWPRGSAAVARRYARASGAEICDEVFVRLGTERYGEVLRRVERSGAEAVLMLLVGDDAVQFNRAFARVGLDQQVLRLSTLMEENMLLASGADSTRDLFASAGFFDSLATSDSLDFHRPVQRPLWARGAGAQQPRRVLLRGRAAAGPARPAGRQPGRGPDLRGRRHRRLRRSAGAGAAAGPPPRAAGLPGQGRQHGLRGPGPAHPDQGLTGPSARGRYFLQKIFL
jgi:hypothetical protein